VGTPWPGARAVSLVRSGRFGGYRPSARGGESGECRRNLELSHDRGPDAIHDGAPRTGSRGSTGFGPKGRTSGIKCLTCGEHAAREACRSQGVPLARQIVGTEIRVAYPEEEIVLPHLRFNRDKRGYENTFLVHTHGTGGRRRGKPRSRILYWFRTPPGVRIGRAALDEDAIRLIEEHNPDVEFDWTRILKAQESPVESRTQQPDRRPRPRPRDTQPREAATRPAPIQNTSPPPEVADAIHAALHDEAPAFEPAVADEVDRQQTENVEPPEAEVIEEFLAEPRVEVPPLRPQPGDAISAVEGRLGAEGLSRLRARYSEVMARISETIADPERRDELKSQAERLNPDTWVTEAEMTAGLESYESVFESLRTVVGRRRRRRRRSGRQRNGDIQETRTEISNRGFPQEPSGEADEMDGLDTGEEQ
jgi:hypothetical protein